MVHTAGAVKAAVASLDGLVNLVRAGVIVDLPQTKAHEGHVKTTVQLDGRSSHFSWMMNRPLAGYQCSSSESRGMSQGPKEERHTQLQCQE